MIGKSWVMGRSIRLQCVRVVCVLRNDRAAHKLILLGGYSFTLPTSKTGAGIATHPHTHTSNPPEFNANANASAVLLYDTESTLFALLVTGVCVADDVCRLIAFLPVDLTTTKGARRFCTHPLIQQHTMLLASRPNQTRTHAHPRRSTGAA